MTVRKCGWPIGTSISDGQCDQPAVTVYVVRAHHLPLHDVNDESTEMALALCQRHDPNFTPQTSDQSAAH